MSTSSESSNGLWADIIFRDAVVPIVVEDLDGKIIDLNSEAERCYGFPRKTLIGMPITTLVPPERHAQAKELLARCLAGEEVRSVDGLRWNREQQLIPVLITLSPLRNVAGETIAVATVAEDISELKSAEETSRRMAKVFMDAADPILLEDLQGTIIDLNREAERCYGFKREELIGKEIKVLVPPERHIQADELLARCLAGEEVRNVEGLRRTSDQQVVPVLITLSALKSGAGETIAIATIAKDITELKAVESDLERERESLEIRVTERTRELTQTRSHLQELSEKLSRYLSPQVYQTLFEGSRDARIETRRKWMTVFFSDLVGFTAIAEKLDPEELTTMLNEYLIEMTEIVFKYGGTLDKYIGDAILVFFGDPDTRGREEDAYACVAMALEMQERLKVLREHWALRGVRDVFHVRVGITSGFSTVGNFGSDRQMSYTIIGRQVNLASRLQSGATPGDIVITKPTWALVSERVKCEPAEPISAKGFEEPVEVFTVVGMRDPRMNTGVIKRTGPGFSLWLDPDKAADSDRDAVINYLRRALKSVEDHD